MAKQKIVTRKFKRGETILPPPQVTVVQTFKKIEGLISTGKFSEASVALLNRAEDLAPEDFKTLNKTIKDNFPKNKNREGDYPTSCGRPIKHGRRNPGSCHN